MRRGGGPADAARRRDLRKARLRTAALNFGARVLGRELIHLDFDQLVRRGVITVGRHSFGRPVVRGYYVGTGPQPKVRIGSFCSLTNDAEFVLGAEHRTDWVTSFPVRDHFGTSSGIDGPFARGDIVVGNDVWIGYSAKILSGVTIGDGAVVGVGSLVTKDVRPYAIVVGNPAREIRRRFEDHQVEELLKIRWWDWPDEQIAAAGELLCSERIDDFIARFAPSDK